jgi:hypothetical protein
LFLCAKNPRPRAYRNKPVLAEPDRTVQEAAAPNKAGRRQG